MIEEKEVFSKAGVHFGSSTKKWNPKMLPYIEKRGKKKYILYLPKVISCFNRAKEKIKNLSAEKKIILFVGTNLRVSALVKETAMNSNFPYLTYRWIGGFLTNFEMIIKRVGYLRYLIRFQQSEEFTSLSKKDQRIIREKAEKLSRIYEGVINLREKPHAILIIGINKEKTAIKEASKLAIPVIAIGNTDCDPSLVDYLIPGNDSGKSLEFLLNSLAESIKEEKEIKEDSLDEKAVEEEINISKE